MYSRQIDGQTLTLAPSGWTYDFTFVLVDRETGSLWYPDDQGLWAIQGPLFQRHLPKLPSTDTKWGLWQSDHPESRVLP